MDDLWGCVLVRRLFPTSAGVLRVQPEVDGGLRRAETQESRMKGLNCSMKFNSYQSPVGGGHYYAQR